MFIKRGQGVVKLRGTAVENTEDVKHKAPTLSLTEALGLHPDRTSLYSLHSGHASLHRPKFSTCAADASTQPVFYYIPAVSRSNHPPWRP